jgi:hypothetical protein
LRSWFRWTRCGFPSGRPRLRVAGLLFLANSGPSRAPADPMAVPGVPEHAGPRQSPSGPISW